MRIIHTADWHIGQTLAGYGREHEHRAALDRLIAIAEEQAADAMIVAGDVFDHQNPSGESQRLLFDTILELRRACRDMTIVMTAGNHDAAGRLEAPAALFREMNVHIVGNVRRIGGRIDAARHLVPLRDAGGEIAANVVAVSYPTAACLPPFATLDSEGASPIAAATRSLYDEIMSGCGANRDNLPTIVTGHLHVAGAIESEGAERRILVGGQHAVPASIFANDANYVALGHLHKAQAVGRATIRYSGSLFPLSATEANYDHGVTLVTLEGGTARAEHIAIARPVPFLRIPERGELRAGELADHLAALGLPADLPVGQQPFVHVHLSRDSLSIGHRAEIDRIAASYPVRIAGISAAPSNGPIPHNESDAVALRLAELQPEDMFARAFAKAHDGRAPSPAHLEAFHRAAAYAAEV